MSDPFFKDDPKPAEQSSPADLDKESIKAEGEPKFENELPADDRRMASIMAYIPFLCFVPLLSMSDNKEVRFHARQGVFLFIIELLAVLFLVDAISNLFFKGILIFAAALSVAGLIFAVQGKMQKLPIVGDLIEKSKF